MEALQVLLILMGLGSSAGGVVMLFRNSRRRDATPRSAYAPLAIIFMGLMVAYRVYSDFRTLDRQDLVILFVFVFALLTLLGAQFFIVDRNRDRPSD